MYSLTGFEIDCIHVSVYIPEKRVQIFIKILKVCINVYTCNCEYNLIYRYVSEDLFAFLVCNCLLVATCTHCYIYTQSSVLAMNAIYAFKSSCNLLGKIQGYVLLKSVSPKSVLNIPKLTINPRSVLSTMSWAKSFSFGVVSLIGTLLRL